MISRKSALAIANAYTEKFSFVPSSPSAANRETVFREEFCDYLYERDYEPWFANMVKTIYGARTLKEWLMQLHTGESFVKATEKWPWEKRRALGQTYLKNLARDYIVWFRTAVHKWDKQESQRHHDALLRQLELDGYVFRDDELYLPEGDILDIEAETGLLENLYRDLRLDKSKEAFEFVKLSESHFVSGRWSDCIGNARKFFELTLQQVAARHSTARALLISNSDLERPVAVREYLESKGLLEKKEREAIDKIYGLLSHTGAHPYMAEKDQARLLRQVAMTTAQFVLLRLEGALR